MAARITTYPEYKDSGLPWLGQIPVHWEARRNGRLFAERIETGYPDLPILEVSLRTGVRLRDLENAARKQLMSDRAGYKRAIAGDIAYNMMRMWQGAIGVAPEAGLVSPAYVVARPYPEVDSRYYAYLFRTAAYMREVDTYSRGIVSDRNRLYWDEFKQMPSCFPPRAEQTAIADYLDRHGALVRRYIRNRRRLIELLNERKQAIITQAVTRGLDPSAHLKPSGIDWLGDIPEHWEVVTLRRVIRRAVDGPHHSPSYCDHGVPFISARNIKADRWCLDDAKFISESDYAEFSRRVVPELGDVLYTKGGTTGVARAVDLAFRFQVWVHVAVLKVVKSKVLPEFLAAALNSPRCYEQSQLFTRGATNQDLGLSRMKGIVLALPPLADQTVILAYLDELTGHVSAAIDCIRREITLVREYRERLIADVVTGKFDVRGAFLPDIGDEIAEDALPDLDAIEDEADEGVPKEAEA